MYFILLTEYSAERADHITPHILSHFDESAATAIERLNYKVRCYVREQFGSKMEERASIVDIDTMSEVKEPSEYGVYLYKLTSQPERVYLYTKEIHTLKSEGWFYDTMQDLATWRQAAVFDLVHYRMGEGVEESASELEMVPAGRHKVRVPKQMTIAPCVDLIAELRRSDRFLQRRRDTDNMALEF